MTAKAFSNLSSHLTERNPGLRDHVGHLFQHEQQEKILVAMPPP
jgi:hypothetical protein